MRLAHLLAQNHIYGCTMMINKALSKKVYPIPKEAENHDYWVALIASVFGTIKYLDKRTILYRQHNRNISGSHDNSSFKKRFRRIFIEGKNFKDAGARYTMMQVLKIDFILRCVKSIKKHWKIFWYFMLLKVLCRYAEKYKEWYAESNIASIIAILCNYFS